jgi:hypothetical protein
MTLSRPSPPSTGLDLAALNGSLLLVRVRAYEARVTTRFDTEGKPAIRCDVAVLDGPLVNTSQGDVLLFGSALVRSLSDHEGEYVVGRLGQGARSGSNNAPWILLDPSDADLRAAQDFLARRGITVTPPPPPPPASTPPVASGNDSTPTTTWGTTIQTGAATGQPTGATDEPPF